MPANLDTVPLQQQVSRIVLHTKRFFDQSSECFRSSKMWKLGGILILLSHAVIANNENSYFLSETDENESSEALENWEGTTLDFVTSEAPMFGVNEKNHRQYQQSENEKFSDDSRFNSEEKRSIDLAKLRDRTSENGQVPAPMATLLYWPNPEDQVIGMENRGHPLIQERRNPLFSPWGGKRDTERYRTLAKIRRPVRVPFNSWGGKRNNEGVLSPLAHIEENRFVNWKNKKSTAFNSWGGKRALINFHQNYETADKEFYEMDDHRVSRESEKPSTIGNGFDDLSWLESAERTRKPVKSFSNESGTKRGSSEVIGKGDLTNFGSTMGHHFPRAHFEPWGGKRKGELSVNNDDPRSTGATLIVRKFERIFPLTE